MSARRQERSALPPMQPGPTGATSNPSNPWNALWAMMVGFFMILVDSTIVAVANPSIMEKLQTDYTAVIWVTSSYLLAYAVPLLVAGRLGDQYGPKMLYLIGLAVFTAASLWCGLSGTVEMLIVARLVQGIGAALLTPQTLSTITRIFPAERRGAAMSVWGATAGVATLVGPLAGGVLVDHLGWQWIFFVNVPIGVIGLVLAVRLIPELPTHRHRFDVRGVVLSGAAMFLVVFGLQEGSTHHWAWWIWVMIVGGVAVLGVFVYWQSVNEDEPLIPLRMFGDRNFTLSNIGVAIIGFAVTAMVVPTMFYAQLVLGLTPTQSALLTAPMALASGMLAPMVGRIVDRVHPRPVIGFGFAVLAISLTWLSAEMTPQTPIWRLLVPFMFIGVAMAFIWAPLAATATRNLSPELAGAGSGVYNATRQLGSVLGSAAIAAFMSAWISAQIPGAAQMRPSGALELPPLLREPFAVAMSQSTLLPAVVALFGVVAALFLVDAVVSTAPNPEPRAAVADAGAGSHRRRYPPLLAHTVSYPEGYVDDDDAHVEFSVDRSRAADSRHPDNRPDDPPAGPSGESEAVVGNSRPDTVTPRFRELPPPYAFDSLDGPVAETGGKGRGGRFAVPDCVEHQGAWLSFDHPVPTAGDRRPGELTDSRPAAGPMSRHRLADSDDTTPAGRHRQHRPEDVTDAEPRPSPWWS